MIGSPSSMSKEPPNGPADPRNVGLSVEQLEEENARLREKLAKLPGDWETDSSLEMWFPLSAETLTRLESENAKLRTTKRHMDACRELLDVPDDDVLYLAIEELQAKYSSLLNFGQDVHGECKALRAECERLKQMAADAICEVEKLLSE